jgi:amidase
MQANDYGDYDGIGLAQAIQRGEFRAEDVLDAAVARIKALNPVLNAVTELNVDFARAQLASADPTAPLAGVPFLAKDMNIAVQGLKLTQSSRWLAGLSAATVDAPLASRWRKAGLSILGRTNLPECAADFVCEPTFRGATANPWDLTRSPGGSSGGAAAAVAAGMVPIAHGTDSGGSIRVPAAACGLVGLKPSRGLVPVGPAMDELAGGFNCEHVLTRSVRDCALMLDVTAGPDHWARTPLGLPDGGFLHAVQTRLQGLRVGVVLREPAGSLPDGEIGEAVEAVGRVLAREGHSVVPFTLPPETDIGRDAAVIWMTAISEDIEFHTHRVGRPPERGELDFVTYECWQRGRAWKATNYVAARRACSRATGALAAAMADLDLLILPTTATLPPLTGEIDGRTGAMSFEEWGAAAYAYAPYTELFNVTGMPAISLPLAVSATGLPIGIQLVAPLGADTRLLTIAARLEEVLPWEGRLAELRNRWRQRATLA